MSYSLLYIAIGLLVVVLYMKRHKRLDQAHTEELEASKAAGLGEPASLHPIINPVLCIGSGSCVQACPEDALGVVGGKAVLKNAAACIGHGACKAACPIHAIELVFGTEKRGMEIPNLTPEFESNMPGIYIAGELGGMGLIRNACAQGRQAMDAIKRRGSGSGKADLDVVVVGCGPAGLSAGLSAIEHKLRYKLLEQEDSLGGAVYHYPRNKIAMTRPVDLAVVGKVRFGEVQKEKLLEFWNDIVQKTGLQVSFRERMEHIEREGDIYVVKTNKGEYRTRNVLLTLGRRGTPRKLDVPGEETPKVVYRLIDAEQYRGQAVLVVGGGDSALEAAIALAAEEGTDVTLSYRSEAFSRVKQKNRTMLEEAQKAGRLRVLMKSTVKSISDNTVDLELDGGERRTLRNDAVIVCAGGLLPTPLLQKIGIQFDTKFGTV